MYPRTEIFNISDLWKSKARCSWAAETVRGKLVFRVWDIKVLPSRFAMFHG